MFRSFARFSVLALFFSSACILTLYASVGTESWRQDLGESISASPLVRDLDGDGDYEIILSTLASGVRILDHDGNLLPEWPEQFNWILDMSVPDWGDVLVSQPVVYDFDENGMSEVVISDQYGAVHLFSEERARIEGWLEPKFLPSGEAPHPKLKMSPTVADVDGDGQFDVVVGDDLGYLHAWKFNGDSIDLAPNSDQENHLRLDGAIYALLDVTALEDNSDEKLLLIHTDAPSLYLINGYGMNRPGWPISPDSDAFGILGSNIKFKFDEKLIQLYDAEDVLQSETLSLSDLDIFNVVQSMDLPVLTAVDLDGNGELVQFFAGGDGRLIARNQDGSPRESFVFTTSSGAVVDSVVVADLRSDNEGPELVITDTDGFIYCRSQNDEEPWEQQVAGDRREEISGSPIVFDFIEGGDAEVLVPVHAFQDGNFIYVYSSSGELINVLSLPGYQWVGGPAEVTSKNESDQGLELFYAGVDYSRKNSELYSVELLPHSPLGVSASPSIGDIDGDGNLDLVTGGFTSTFSGGSDGYLHSWELDGSAKSFGDENDHAGKYRLELEGGIKSSLVRLIDVDVDGDSRDEILVHTSDSQLYLFNGDGSERWSHDLGGTRDNYGNNVMVSSPLALDFDFDGKIEIAVAVSNGEIHVYNADGTPMPDWYNSELSTWSSSTDGAVKTDGTPKEGSLLNFSSLVAADLGGDHNLELIIASTDGHVYAWELNGNDNPLFKTEISTEAPIYSSVAVADIHSEQEGVELVVVDTFGNVYCFSSSGHLLWKDLRPSDQPVTEVISASPIIVDYNNDGNLDVIAGRPGKKMVILDASRIYTETPWKKSEQEAIPDSNLDPLDTFDGVRGASTPACADIDNDGSLELVYVAEDEYFTNRRLICVQLSTTGDRAINSTAFGWNGFLGDRGEISNGPTGDLDSDLMPDSYELGNFKTIAFGSDDDFDQDRFTNYEEFVAATNPTDPNDQLSFFSMNTGEGDEGPEMQFLLQAKAGRSYKLMCTQDLQSEWSVVESVDIIEDRAYPFSVAIQSDMLQCFYSIRVSLTAASD